MSTNLTQEYAKYNNEKNWDTYINNVRVLTERLIKEHPEENEKLVTILDYIHHPDIDDIAYSQNVILGLASS